MNHNLDYLTDDELISELKKRKEAIKRKEEERIRNHQNKIKEHISALICLSEHVRGECTDENPCNHWNHECPRCCLLLAAKENYVGDILVEIVVKGYEE